MSTCGTQIPVETVFVESLRYIKERAMEIVNRQFEETMKKQLNKEEKSPLKKGFNKLTNNKSSPTKEQISAHKIVHSVEDIQWMLSVPAIWSNRSKASMMEWAEKAGMIFGGHKKVKDHLVIVYGGFFSTPFSLFPRPVAGARVRDVRKTKTHGARRQLGKGKKRKTRQFMSRTVPHCKCKWKGEGKIDKIKECPRNPNHLGPIRV